MKIQVEASHYNLGYDSKERFCSYWHQINEITKLNPQNVLEVGIGNGFVSEYLKKHGLNITTADVDKGLKPDIVASVLSLPISDNVFDVVVCYETLEHMPYENFSKALLELKRVSKKYVLISLPDVHKVWRYVIHIPRFKEIMKLIYKPRIKLPEHIFDGQHYWEIGKKGYALKKVSKDICACGFKISNTYRPFEITYHRFFVLEKV
ncbi:MAG: class I SAM-dependent methyltransferase [Candidatus Omnitrophica bacterium]|nr:class I SAM-dependent methyltransferase [Candidatus Omnitrophota bacterium]